VTPPILTTKLFIPPLRADLLRRPHLVEQLNRGASRKLTLLSASAGSGKTTLLSEWSVSYGRRTAWLSLDPDDNDPALFLTYLIAALQNIRADFGDAAVEILGSSETEQYQATLVNIINELAGFPENATLILDDFHVISDPRIYDMMAYLINHLPPQVHLVIASRVDPPLPLARYRARNQLSEIRGQDLRFNAEETAQFFHRTVGLQLSVEDAQALEERTEGWVAGLQLAALSMKGRGDIPGFVEAFAGSHLFVAEFLVEEILRRQSEDVQLFLLQTSILERLNADLCEAVSARKGGQAVLTTLYRANVFVIALDDQGQWFRYHHLFSDLLQARLPQVVPPEEILALHRRASMWYERNGYYSEAVHHALAGEDFDRAVDLVKQAARALIFAGRVNTLRDWLEALPEASFDAHPHLTFYRFWIDVLQSRADLSEQALHDKEELFARLPSSPKNDRMRGELMAVVCRAVALSGRTTEGIRLAQDALAYLPPDEVASRARANSALATAYDLEGQATEAEPAYQESVSQAVAAGDLRLAAHTMMVSGLVQYQCGHLHDAANTFQSIIDMGDEGSVALADQAVQPPGDAPRARKVFFPAGQGYVGLGCIHLEWNDLKRAENHLEKGLELCRRGGLDGVFVARMQMSRLRQAQGDLEAALQEIQLPDQAHRVDDFNIATRKIQIALAQGDVDGAWHWAAPFAEMLDTESASKRMPLLFFEILQAVIARVYLARGEVGKALQLIDRLHTTAEPGRRIGRLVEVYLLKALVDQKRRHTKLTSDAVQNMARALELGAPQGYALLFLEEGAPLVPLLEAVTDQRTLPSGTRRHARKLLEAFGKAGYATAPQLGGKSDELVEQLTPREMEVLTLVASGHTNQAIAEMLVITVRTVKKHTSNIYGKLNVSSRTQAVAYARQIGLLPPD
jgi:LuxR family maltose regulon positive regulatory protein